MFASGNSIKHIIRESNHHKIINWVSCIMLNVNVDITSYAIFKRNKTLSLSIDQIYINN